MNTFTASIFINRPVQEVFDFTINPANAPQWQDGTTSGKWVSDGPVGVGSILNTTARLMGRDISVDAEITEWNPPNVWAQKSSNGPMKFENTNKYESKDGGTLLTQSIQAEIGGFFKMAEGMVAKQLQKQLEMSGMALKKLLEAK